MPHSIRRLFVEAPVQLVIEVREGEVGFLREASGESQEIECYSLQAFTEGVLRGQGAALLGDAQQVVLRLSPAKTLARVISLPAVAETNLRQVAGFEIDRLTPFAASQVYYAVTVLERQLDLRRIKAKLTAAAKAFVDPLIDRLAEMGLPPDAVTVAGEGTPVNLLPPDRRPGKDRLVQRLRWLAVGLVAGLLLTAGVLPLWQQRQLVLELLPRVAAAQKEAEQVLALRKELENAIESSRFLFQKRQENRLVIDLLNELTIILPDGTWVEQLEISDNQIRVQGQSSQASALIGLVEASSWFQGVTFVAPVTADRATGQERYYLAAQISPEP